MTSATSGLFAEAFGLFLVTRLALIAVVGVASVLVPLNEDSCAGCQLTGIPALDDWARWDGRWYVDIAEHGYSYDPNAQSSVAFFPLFPFAMRLLALPFPSDRTTLVIAGILLANVATVIAISLVLRLARSEVGGSGAHVAALLLLVFPTTVFLSAMYPESLLLALATGALLFARSGRWAASGVAGALATLTKPFGVAIVVALLLEAARRRELGRRSLPLILPALAAVGWWVYLTALTGEPWAFFLTQSKFRHRFDMFGGVAELFDPTAYGFPYFVGALFVLTIAFVVAAWRRLSPSVAAYGTLILAFIMSNGTLSSSMRYELNVLPLFLALSGVVAGRRLAIVLVAVSTALALLLAAMFSRQYWIG